MNNKGFTTVEIVLSFALVVIILASLTGVVIHYRDQVTEESVKTQLLDYKNTITKIVYDDIIMSNYKSVEYCFDDPLCINFVDQSGEIVSLKAYVNRNATEDLKRGIFIEYKGISYMLPDSDINEYSVDVTEEKYIVNINNFILTKDEDNNFYKVSIPIHHQGYDANYNINLIIT